MIALDGDLADNRNRGGRKAIAVEPHLAPAHSNLLFSLHFDPDLADAGIGGVLAIEHHGRLLLAFAEAAASAPAVEDAWQASIAGFVDLAAMRIDALVAADEAELDHPRETATALVWMTERFLLESYGRGAGVPDSTAAEVLALVWRRTLFS